MDILFGETFMSKDIINKIEEHAVNVLEFNAVREILSTFSSSELGRSEALKLYPSTNREWIIRSIAETTEIKNLLDAGTRLPLAGMRDVRPLLNKAVNRGAPFEPEELLNICLTLKTASSLKAFLSEDSESIVYLKELADQLTDFNNITDLIVPHIGQDGSIADSASDKLRVLRRQISQLKGNIQDKIQSIISDPRYRKAIQNENFMIRYDRPVIAIKTEYKYQIPGIVLDRSRTGSTVFIQPQDLVHLSNQFEDLLSEERIEVSRILWEYTKYLVDNLSDIKRTINVLAHIDLAYAKAQYSRRYMMNPPEIIEELKLDLKKARHPLLLCMMEKENDSKESFLEKVVPISPHLGGDFDMLILTGPNTGGKTVTLKTIGLSVLMAQSGMHIPASQGSFMPIFKQIFTDIGDEQSIEQSLSTFSSHISQIVHILRNACEGSLILLDELGAGTDPSEGAALGEAILKEILEKNSLSVITTHLGSLKDFAYSTPRTNNASVEFDMETLRPTYNLLIGQPGSSNALAIAEKLGIPEQIINNAKGLISEDFSHTSVLINRIQSTRVAAEKSREDAETALENIRKIENEKSDELVKIKTERERISYIADQELDRSMKQVKRAVDSYLDSIKNAPKELTDKSQEFLDNIEEAASNTPLAIRHAKFIESVKKGDYVYVIALRQDAMVHKINKKRQIMELAVNRKHVVVPFDQIAPLPYQAGQLE